MVVPLLLCGIGVLFATCAACFYRMGAADWDDEKKFLIDSLESLASKNAKLRELAADLIKWCEGPCCGCIDYENCDGTPIYEFWSATKDRARELGVEVSE